MPIYEYYCNSCNETFTKKRSIKEDSSKEECPICKETCKKIPSLTNFKLVGNGWASDGYK